MNKVICHTFVLVAPTKAHGECDTYVFEGVGLRLCIPSGQGSDTTIKQVSY